MAPRFRLYQHALLWADGTSNSGEYGGTLATLQIGYEVLMASVPSGSAIPPTRGRRLERRQDDAVGEGRLGRRPADNCERRRRDEGEIKKPRRRPIFHTQLPAQYRRR